jgi:hypothetical protein
MEEKGEGEGREEEEKKKKKKRGGSGRHQSNHGLHKNMSFPSSLCVYI